MQTLGVNIIVTPLEYFLHSRMSCSLFPLKVISTYFEKEKKVDSIGVLIMLTFCKRKE
jgi:hypothetical protein